jgi:predicted metal-binding protein
MKVAQHMDTIEGLSHIKRHEVLLPLGEFEFSQKVKDQCLSCSTYAKNLSCPPHSPDFIDYIGNAKEAKVICMRLPLERIKDLEGEERSRAGFKTLSSLLADELLKHREEGYIVAGAGACSACDICSVDGGIQLCIKPEEQLFSLESLGVNLSALVKRCFDFSLQWSNTDETPQYVCALGATFFVDKSER